MYYKWKVFRRCFLIPQRSLTSGTRQVNDASGPPVSCMCPYCFHMLLIPRRCARTAALVTAASVTPPAAHQYSRARFFLYDRVHFSPLTRVRRQQGNYEITVSRLSVIRPRPHTPSTDSVCGAFEANEIHADKITIIGNRTQTNEEAIKREQGAILARFFTLNEATHTPLSALITQ